MNKYEILGAIIADKQILERYSVDGLWKEVSHKEVLAIIAEYWDDFDVWPRFIVVEQSKQKWAGSEV